jgi:hypothetical protein
MSAQMTLGAARLAWERLWDRGKANNKTNNTTNKKIKYSKKTIRRQKRDKLPIQYQQTQMSGANMDQNDVEYFGDDQQQKRPNTLRVGFHNIYNLPEDRRTSKSRQLVDYIVQKSYDCFLMVEPGLNWKKVGNNDRWYERIWGKLKTSRSIFAHNVTELPITKVLQPGGVGMITTEEVTHRVIATGKDPTGLGRWCWMQLQGRNGIRIRLISVYRPCETPGATTTFQQQNRYLRRHKSDFAPREALYDALYLDCSSWLSAGDRD